MESILINYKAASNFLFQLNNTDNKILLIMTAFNIYLTSLCHTVSGIFSLVLRSLEILSLTVLISGETLSKLM